MIWLSNIELTQDWYDLDWYPSLKLVIQGFNIKVSGEKNVDGILFIKVDV